MEPRINHKSVLGPRAPQERQRPLWNDPPCPSCWVNSLSRCLWRRWFCSLRTPETKARTFEKQRPGRPEIMVKLLPEASPAALGAPRGPKRLGLKLTCCILKHFWPPRGGVRRPCWPRWGALGAKGALPKFVLGLPEGPKLVANPMCSTSRVFTSV